MTEEEKKKKKAEYDREYRAKNREKRLKQQRDWYQLHKGEKQQYDIEYRKNNVEKRKEVKAAWNKKNKAQQSAYNKEFYNTIPGMASRRRSHYLADDKEKGFDTAQTVTAEWIAENILTASCIYCHDAEPYHLGCDRIDENKGHTPDNVVCACPVCNWERSLHKMSVEEFIEYRKTHPRLKNTMNDGLDRKTGEKKVLKKKSIPGLGIFYD